MAFIRTALLFLMCFAGVVFTECSEGCQSCLNSTCLSCDSSYYLSNGFCSKCPEDCTSCNDFDDCTSCKPRKHGLHARCPFPCDGNCLNGECQDDTGYCTQCRNGFYGLQCQHNCSFCANENCDLRACSHGCKDGYYEETRGEEILCSKCPSDCRHCKNGKTCQVCNDDFHLYKFNDNVHCISCSRGSECLDYCVIQGCNECQIRDKSLTCIDCPEGQNFNGITCETNASSCSKECSTYCDSNGICEGKCNDGWTGEKCANKCSDRCFKCSKENGENCDQCQGDFYSMDCRLVCSSGCVVTEGNITCRQSDGYCLNGCKQNTWGETCNMTCLSVCKDSTCDRNNGKCQVDCKGNGQECTTSTPVSQTVSSTSKNASSTTPKSGVKKEVKQDNDTSDITVIAAAAGGGFLVLILIIVISVCLLKRRRKSANTSDNATNEAVVANRDDTAHSAHNEAIATENQVVYAKPNKKADGFQESQDYIYAQPDKSHKQKKAIKKEISPPKSMYDNIAIDLNDVEEAPDNGYATVAIGRESVGETEETDVDEIKLEDLDDGNSKLIDTEVEPPSADLYYNTASLIRSRIQLSDFLEYTKNKTDFESEFEKLPKGLTRPCDIALMRINRIKNRYNGVYAYDATRVPLQNKSYINANYIDGHKKSPEYIASLGPTKTAMNNFKDFWEMVWLERTDKIIMLTNLEESGKMKCEQYWPDQGKTKSYQGYKVVCIAETSYSEFTIREFHVSDKSSEPRTVVQYHYTAWPDRSVPDNVASLVEFRNKVEQRKSQDAGPIVVHCSAGIGRTGTYIALDTLIQESKDENYIDIFGRVMALRGQRGHMVQNLEQYIFLHRCLLYALTCDPYPLPVTDIPLIMTDEKISQQFQTFSDVVIPKGKGFDRKSSANPKTRKENRKGADIHGDQYRVKLCSTKHDYINAVYVHGYKSRNKFIVAQTPLPNTVEDFISMLYHEQCACVVDLDDDNIKYKTIGHYLPLEGKVTKVGHFQVACQKSETLKHAIVRSLVISSTGLKHSHEVHVKHYQYKCWTQSEKVPSSVESFLVLVKDAENVVREQKLERPIIVHCLTGAERSCLFCAVSIIVEKCSLEKEISVLNTICQLRSRRKTAFSDITTVGFCYDCCKSIGTNADRKQYYNMVKLL